jgi:hypothetical protein
VSDDPSRISHPNHLASSLGTILKAFIILQPNRQCLRRHLFAAFFSLCASRLSALSGPGTPLAYTWNANATVRKNARQPSRLPSTISNLPQTGRIITLTPLRLDAIVPTRAEINEDNGRRALAR